MLSASGNVLFGVFSELSFEELKDWRMGGRSVCRSGVGAVWLSSRQSLMLSRPPAWPRYRAIIRDAILILLLSPLISLRTAYCSSSYPISVMVIIPLISPIQGLCSLIALRDQRCHPDPPATIKPRIVPPHNAPQNSTFWTQDFKGSRF